ncbi:hypothetical protein PRNP1_011249 [Phytophthora ramorum]
MPPRAGSRSRRRSSDKLPALRPSGSNQRDADAVAQWDDRHRRLRRRKRRELEPLPQLAYVYLPPVPDRHRYSDRARPTRQYRRRCPSSSDSSEVDDSSASVSDEDVRVPPSTITTMRSQRMRSLAAMSKLQYDAATTIQREYRFYRRRRASRHRRNEQLAQQAQDFLDIFLRQEVTNLVPVCLLDVLRETCSQEATTTKRREDLAASLAGSVLSSLIDECIRDVFHGVLQAMVKAYLVQRLDLSRAATPPVHAVAADVLNDWVKELVAELLPEVIVELTSEYTARQQHEQIWEELLHDELQSLAADAVPVNSTTSALQQTDQVNSADNAHSNPPL